MRLSKIRIAGFKSFVDPVTLDLRSNLTGILGPNGCGKSNTIDAVRWVMGESSAKHLRGASMEDVIFNGSSSRKPVGLASVELVFDNSDGTLGGEYANYAEISVKRQVSRDGDSKYFLNGSKCRRRDITDIFLGTGLGPRSYAIIEQGMISRLIEAKPEDLRNTLEEAAGISRYKERRRETETRMAHTRENLERLTDLRDELEKQLERLDKQAKAAQRFRELRDDERKLEASVLLLQWASPQSRQRTPGCTTSASVPPLIRRKSPTCATSKPLSKTCATNTADANETLNAVQGEYYQAGADIARIEQSIQHQRDIQRRQQDALRNAEQSIEETLRHATEDRDKLSAAEHALADLEPREAELAEQLSMAEDRLLDAEDPAQRLARTMAHHPATGCRTHPPSTSRKSPHGAARTPAATNQPTPRTSATRNHQPFHRPLRRRPTTTRSPTGRSRRSPRRSPKHNLPDLTTNLSQQQQEQREVQAQLDQARSRRQSLQGRLASLETLQQVGLGQSQ